MKDPVDLPLKGTYHFVCINMVTGHIRNEKTMTASHAYQLNNLNHMMNTPYKWVWNDQRDFNSKLTDDARLVPLV